MLSSAFGKRPKFSVPYHLIGCKCRIGTSKFFGDQEIFAFCKSSSYHSSGWVPTSSAKVFFQETPARHRYLAAHQNEYLPQVSGWVEGHWVQERAAVSSAAHSVHTFDWHRHAQGRTPDLQDQASWRVPPQHAHLLLWEQKEIPCTDCCGPSSHQIEGAAQEVPSSCQGYCETVRGTEESPRSWGISRHRLNKRRCYGPQGGD